MTKAANSFGSFFKEKRISQGLTLRRFCLNNGFDPGNISKLEREVFAAPHSKEKLEKYASALGIKSGSEDWIEFFDLAAVSNQNLGLLNFKNKNLMERLPVLFRTLDNQDISEEKLDHLIELIKES